MPARVNRILNVISVAVATNLAVICYLEDYLVPFTLFVGIGVFELYRLIEGVE